jgi:uncharacterized protein
MFHMLLPSIQIESVLELNVKRLQELNINYLLLDVDCTLKRYREKDVRPEVAGWLESLKVGGIKSCIFSNGREGRIKTFAEKLDLPYVSKALKPLPFKVALALNKMQARPEQSAIVGDQLFADILAGRLAGIKSVLVKPLHPEDEHWYTRIKRPLEKIVMRLIKK